MVEDFDIAGALKPVIEKLQSLLDQLGDKGPFTFLDYSGVLTIDGVVSALIFMGLMVALAFFFYRNKKALDFCDRYLTYAFVAVWTLGFVVYDVGMYPDHSLTGWRAFWATLDVAPMAIIHAFEMFILQSDVSAIHDGCHDSAWFMFFFSIAHLLAAFISMVFVIKHFGFNIVANFIRMIKTHFLLTNVDDLYVFWGMNDATYYLAKDIIRTKRDINSRTIIIRVNNKKEDPNKLIGMDRLFSFLSLSNSNLDNLQELQKKGCLTNSTFGSLTDITANSENDLIGRELRLSSLVKMMNHTQKKVHMFLLDDDEVFNIQAVANLKRDKSVNAYVQNKKITFYCHARYNSIHRVIEDEPSHKNIEIRVIDSSHISVELLKLKKNLDLQPVNYVKIEDDATVSSAFNALVVGFSEVGTDMVRFLYEFGAFVKSGSTDDNVMRSDFHCDVVDKMMSSLAGQFVANAPAIRPGKHFCYKNDERESKTDQQQQIQQKTQKEEKSLIDLHEMDCQSVAFYDKLKEWLPKLNYIVLATDNDELNVSHAIRIFRLAIRYRDDMEKLRIMVRIKHDENKHFKRIAEHYNRLWAADGKKDKNFHQKVVTATKANDDDIYGDSPITIFGSTQSIYTFDHIINESLKEKAKTFKDKYDDSLAEQQRAANQEPWPTLNWDQEQNDLMQLTGKYAGFSPTYSGMMKLRRVQSQNVANSLHAATKNKLAKDALKERYNIIKEHGLTRAMNQTDYTWEDHSCEPIGDIQRVMDVLAQTEHLRWEASHQILGYQCKGGINFKDEAKLLHGCICDWSKLDDEHKSYDYNTVDVSLSMYDSEEQQD